MNNNDTTNTDYENDLEIRSQISKNLKEKNNEIFSEYLNSDFYTNDLLNSSYFYEHKEDGGLIHFYTKEIEELDLLNYDYSSF